MTRILTPLVTVVTLALLLMWLQPQPSVVADPLGTMPPVVNAGLVAPSATTNNLAERGASAPATTTSDAGAAEPAATERAAGVEPPVEAEPEVAETEAAAPVEAEPEVAETEAVAPVEAEPEVAEESDAAVPMPAVEAPPARSGNDLLALVAPNNVSVPEGFQALPYLSTERRLAFEAPELVIDPQLDYLAILETNRGTIVVELLPEAAPNTVNNFIFLARHKYYDGVVFHRVIEGFMAQTGDPTGSGTGGPGYTFADEFGSGLTHAAAGILSMANAGPGTNGSQFFITFAPTPWLDNAHTIFGRVIDGAEVLDQITRVDPTQPSAVAFLDDLAQVARDQGINLVGDGTVLEALRTILGVQPEAGGRYDIAGASVVIGAMSGQPAAGFFPFPDRMTKVIIATPTPP
jgi:peptidylprolyl isomerase